MIRICTNVTRKKYELLAFTGLATGICKKPATFDLLDGVDTALQPGSTELIPQDSA